MDAKDNSKARTAEFARLFDLFERLANRGRSSPVEGENASVPEEFAPVLRNLSALLIPRNYKERSAQPIGGRSFCVAPFDSNLSTTIEEDAVAKFPLNEKYPFTFKLMIHKLYDLEEWADKVKEAVEASQMQYKPLSETETTTTVEKEQTTDVGSRKRVTAYSRIRTQSLVGHMKVREPLSPICLSPTSPTATDSNLRAIKKRCVGRRKSVSGLVQASGTGGVWVYDSTVSSFELVDASRRVLQENKQPPRQRRQSMTGFEAKTNVPLKKFGNIGLGLPQQVAERRANRGNRRALSLTGVTKSSEGVGVKRAFCA